MQEEELQAGPSSQGSTEPWDTTFNRAMNVYRERDKSAPPRSAGRVTGFGTSMKFTEYYSSDGGAMKKERKKTTKDRAEVVELKKKVESLEKEKVDSTTVDKLVTDRIREMFPPALLEGIAAWNAGGQQGPIYVPSFSGSNSTMNPQNLSPDMVTPPPPNAAAQPPLPLVAPTPPTAPAPENKSPAAGTGARVSTLAELDAITKVTN
jgi:hypothetical protein